MFEQQCWTDTNVYTQKINCNISSFWEKAFKIKWANFYCILVCDWMCQQSGTQTLGQLRMIPHFYTDY